MSVPTIIFAFSVQLKKRREYILRGDDALNGIGILRRGAMLCDQATVSAEASLLCEQEHCTPEDLDYYQVTTNSEIAVPIVEGKWRLLRAEHAELLDAPPLSIQE